MASITTPSKHSTSSSFLLFTLEKSMVMVAYHPPPPWGSNHHSLHKFWGLCHQLQLPLQPSSPAQVLRVVSPTNPTYTGGFNSIPSPSSEGGVSTFSTNICSSTTANTYTNYLHMMMKTTSHHNICITTTHEINFHIKMLLYAFYTSKNQIHQTFLYANCSPHFQQRHRQTRNNWYPASQPISWYTE